MVKRQKRDNNFEQRLHRTLSRYERNEKPNRISIPDASESRTNGINRDNNTVVYFQSLNTENIQMLNNQESLKYADDTTDTECTNDEQINSCLRYTESFDETSNNNIDRCKEDYLFDIDTNDGKKSLKLSNEEDRSFFIQFLQTQVYRLKREKRSEFIWRCLGLKFANNFQKSRANDEMWPLFTYWLITMELFIMILLSTQGIAPFGMTENKVSRIIWYQTSSYQPATYYKHPNIWFGPSYSILISGGAKFTPCMRKDRNIMKSFESRKSLENEYGCCLRNDLSGCVQAPRLQCSNRTSVWLKWPNRSGPVCGNDPRYCIDKSMNKSYELDITEWPTCNRYDYKAITRSKDLHMKCNVQARPCCIGIYGKCILASKEYCEFIEGQHHPYASLCSQVNCVEDVCGSFLWPYQFHRLILSIFIHAGWFQLLLNIIVQYVFMRRLEQLLGIWRTVLIYFISGIGGNFASTIFLPLTPDVGPNASILGLIAFLFIESYKQRKKHGLIVSLKIFCALFVLLLPGFSPFVDFYSLVFGFIYGLIVITIVDPRDSKSKLSRILAAISFLVLTLSLLLLFIFATDLLERFRYYTNLFNCIPFLFNCSEFDIVYDEIKSLN